MSNTLVDIKKITAGYGQNIILNEFDLEVNQGEFIGVIGPNGAGKSTLIKALTDLIEIKSGTINIQGKDNSKITKKQRARMVAVVPQEFSIDFDFTAMDIVMMGRNPHIETQRNFNTSDYEISKEAMIMTDTWKFRDRLFNEMSGGEKQRVIISRAIAQQSDIILLDEPTSHLDIHHQLEILELISILKKKKNLTIIAILHDINMAARFCDRLVLLKNGNVVIDGKPEEVITEENLKKTYKMEMIVRDNKLLSTKEIIPLRVITEKRIKKQLRIHVICGGGSGEGIIEKLNSLGYPLSCGILNTGDSDWELCRALNIKSIYEPPFSEFTEEKYNENIICIEESDIVLVTDVPFGSGNLKNLQVLLKINKPIYMKKNNDDIDFVDGKAEEIIRKLGNTNYFNLIDNYNDFIEVIEKEGINND